MNEAYGSDLPCEECGTCECIAKNDAVGKYHDYDPNKECPSMFRGSAPFWVGFALFIAGALWWVLMR